MRKNLRSLAWGGLAVSLLIGLYACGATDHSGDPGLITVKLDSSATRFSRLTVVLQDSTGKPDTLFNDSLRNPAQLQHLATETYRGEKTTIIITGFKGNVQVYQEKRNFNASVPAATKRDTVLDASIAPTAIQWSVKEIIIPVGDTVHNILAAITPKKGDDRALVTVQDSSVVAVRLDGKNTAGLIFRLLTKAPGSSQVVVRSTANPLLSDTVSVLVSQTVLKPLNLSPEWSASSRPTWKWTTGGKGIGIYRCRIDNDTLITAKIFNDTIFQSPDPLAHGPHTLYVQERDADGNWSLKAALVIKVDLIPPKTPAVLNAGLAQTKDRKPGWTWSAGGEGNGTFRYLLDDTDLEDKATQTTALKYTVPANLSDGPHTFRVEERDSAGNWSLPGSAPVEIILSDTLPPNAPLFYGRTGNAAGNFAEESIRWRTGGGGGSGQFRWQIDNADFRLNASNGSADTAYYPAPDSINTHNVLYVQERDSVGNWSLPGRYEFTAVRLSFLQSKVNGGAFVITADSNAAGDGDRIHLARRVTAPKNDSERTLLRRQLWMSVRNTFVEADNAYYIYNPFYNKVLRYAAAGAPVFLGFLENVKTDSSYLWTIPFLVPPPPPGTYRDLPAVKFPGQRLNIQGDAPWTESNNLILWEYSHGQDNEEWRFLPYDGARYIP